MSTPVARAVPTAPARGASPDPRPWRVLGLVGAAVVAVVVGVWFTGAAVASLVRDAGPWVRWGLPVTETLTELLGAVVVGALVLAVGVLPRHDESAAPRRGARAGAARAEGTAYPATLRVAGWAAGAWTLAAVLHLVLSYASVAGRALTEQSFGDELWLYVSQIEQGRTLASAVVVAAVVTALALVVRTPTGAAWTLALALVALWQVAQLGHAAGAAGHELATSAMFVHLVGAAVWIGALAALALLVGRLGRDVAPAVARYSVVAGWCVAAVAVSGLVSGWIRLGQWADLGTRYGVLLVVKAALLVVLAGLGLLHRRRTIAALDAAPAPRPGLFWRLVGVELVVMGAVSGVAVALGSSAPPVPDEPPVAPSVAYQVTGHDLPPEPTLVRWFTEWRWDLLMAFAAVAALVVYWRWVRRLARRGDAWPWQRTAAWTVGLVVFFWTTNGGPATYGHVLFSAHMVQHMVLAMVVPIFLVLSAPVTLALRALPVRASTLADDASRGPREWILTLVHSHVGRFLAHPVVAAVNFAGSMVAFYYTGLFEWSLRSSVGHLFMVVHFTAAGYLFANSLVGVDPGPQRLGYPQRLLTLFATMAFHAFFGVALVSGEALLVADWFGLLGRPWGASAIADQQEGGAVAWGIGELPTLALAIAVALSWSRDDDRQARRRDRRTRDEDPELDAYNAMLKSLAD
ncbi:cytochrome c oxidase assembly protein [Cellulomonas sp.]|uniref:cytochrome c oxidase assembly protein n=1 Tax=Cellulomonas sp. TaxID=40001 RepID=UPI002588C989|nr:cytochrome c oxidase assembly protein [Cellulomonas sp.]MCR6688678.1 bifunctional copper resistance protein CopD/cytochrome c oxidase assembly protein [Cellulomonas sp.]